jgi:CRISPR-associated protein Cas1
MMSTIYITQQGAVLRKVSERLKVTLKGEILLDIPLIKVSQVVIFGKASVTAATVATLLEKEIDVCYLTQHGRYIGRIIPAVSKNSLLRREQYRAAFDDKQTLNLGKGFVVGKLTNMRMFLMRSIREQNLPSECKQAEKRIETALNNAKKAKDLDQVRGHEGEGSAAYFAVFHHLIKPKEFTFEKRERRPPTDPVNALLSFGYTLLTNDMFAAVNIVGFDPYIGYLHADRYGRPSLPLDLIEEFRSVIVDRLVLKCINKQILTVSDFQEEMGHIFKLTDEARKRFLEQYEEQKQTEFTHPVLKQNITYHQSFEQQARFLAKTLQGELKEYPPLLIK